MAIKIAFFEENCDWQTASHNAASINQRLMVIRQESIITILRIEPTYLLADENHDVEVRCGGKENTDGTLYCFSLDFESNGLL